MPDRDLIYNPLSDRYEWATVHDDFYEGRRRVDFADGGYMVEPPDHLFSEDELRARRRLGQHPSAAEVWRDNRLAQAHPANALAQFNARARDAAATQHIYGLKGYWPEAAATVSPATPRDRRITFARVLRRALRLWLRGLRMIRRQARPARATRASVIHHMGFGGGRA